MSTASTKNRKINTHSCTRCGRTGSRQFSFNSILAGWTCDDGFACAKRQGAVLIPSGSFSDDLAAVRTWLQANDKKGN